MKDYREPFERFLKRRRMLRKYFRTLQKLRGLEHLPLRDVKDQFLKRNSVDYPHQLVSRGFNWDDSDEGYEFWYQLHLDWLKYMEKKS